MHQVASALVTLFAATALAGQADTLVATGLPAGAPRTQLLLIDSTTGSWQGVQPFAADGLPPLAVTFDAYDGEVVLALASSNTTSTVVRLRLAGTAVLGERTLGTLPGRCTHLEVVDDAVLATVAGSAGGLYRLPRLGGAAVQLAAEPNAAALMAFGPQGTAVVMAWSAPASAPLNGPGFGYFDLQTNQWILGPWSEPGLGQRVVTGVADLPTALVREVVAFADGGFELVVYGGPPTVPIATSPPIPAGGAAAMKPAAPGSFEMRGLGGAAFPFLYRLDVWTTAPNVTMLAGPLPGDPVDLALVPASGARFLLFGGSCGQPAPHLSSRSRPTLGNQTFAVDLVGGAPLRASAFVLGLSDSAALGALPLPWPLPSGCELRASPDDVVFQLTDASGNATRSLPIPNQPALLGMRLFGQWLQDGSPPFAASEGVALQIGP